MSKAIVPSRAVERQRRGWRYEPTNVASLARCQCWRDYPWKVEEIIRDNRELGAYHQTLEQYRSVCRGELVDRERSQRRAFRNGELPRPPVKVRSAENVIDFCAVVERRRAGGERG